MLVPKYSVFINLQFFLRGQLFPSVFSPMFGFPQPFFQPLDTYVFLIVTSRVTCYYNILVFSAIGKMTEHEESHKVNRRRMGLERQEEDMMRVPIALALVKLLQRLPGDLLRHQLPG